NDIGPKHFILVFAASDGRTTISFRANDFRIVPQVGVKDFQPEQFARWTKPARRFSGTKGLDRIVKNHSDWVWGDLDRCIVACTISGVMCSHAQ
ncbi:MAG: hypothetical protein NTY01_22475, partial [Verrucomicrobia bacterium]|nr:hypothetical protein [Verrucomicrobiota bacterium]